MDRRENVLVFGTTGARARRTCCAAIAQELVRSGRKVLFTTVQPAGAGPADGQARPEAESGAEAAVAVARC